MSLTPEQFDKLVNEINARPRYDYENDPNISEKKKEYLRRIELESGFVSGIDMTK